VDTFLLDQIAEASRGKADYITPKENIEEKISHFFAKVSKPVLTDVEINLAGVAIEDLYPKQLPDLFEKDQLLLVGRYRAAGSGEWLLTGVSQDIAQRFSCAGRFAQKAENEFLPRLWASRKIGYLMAEMRVRGETEEVRKEVEALSKEYGILSPLTAFVAQEDAVLAAQRPVGQGQRHSTFNLQSLSTPAKAGAVSAGDVAVHLSKQLREMKENEVVLSGEQSRYVGEKAFIWQNTEWVESGYQGEAVLSVRRGSQAFINLLKAYPALGRYVAIGEQVVVRWNGKFLRIGETGESERSVEKWRAYFN